MKRDIAPRWRAGPVFVLGWLLIGLALATVGWARTWHALLVPALVPPFADMRTVQGALHSIALGFDPQLINPGDPWGRAMNYPSVWARIAAALGFGNELHYLAFEALAVLVFLACCHAIVRRTDSAVALLAAFSASTLLAVERGNNDVIVFALLFLAAHLGAQARNVPLLLAGGLKIYPLLVLPALAKERRAAWVFGVGAVAVVFALRHELPSIGAGVPVSATLSYGAASLAAALGREFAGFRGAWGAPVIDLVMLAGVLATYATAPGRFDSRTSDGPDRRLFLLGACVFLGTFLLSSNWDYRLIFLILCLPYLLGLRDAGLRRTVLVALILACNQIPLRVVAGMPGFGINVAAKCLLFVLLGAITLHALRQDLSAWAMPRGRLWRSSR